MRWRASERQFPNQTHHMWKSSQTGTYKGLKILQLPQFLLWDASCSSCLMKSITGSSSYMKVSDMHSRIVGAGFSDRLPVPCLQGECEWTRHRKQGVYFLRSPWESSGDGRAAVSYSFTFEPSSGDIKMDFSIESQWCRAIWLKNWLLVPFTSCRCLYFAFVFNINVILLFWQKLLKSCNVAVITKTDQSSVF